MKNNSKLEKILFDRGDSLEELKEAVNLSYPTLVNINKGRVKKYHGSTIKVLCDHLSTPEKQLTKDDIVGLLEEKK